MVKEIDISLLKEAAYNPRVYLTKGDADYEKIERSIDEFGYTEPIVWNERTGNVVGGHQRLKVLKESRPCMLCHSKRRYDQNLRYLKTVKHQVIQCRQHDAGLTHTHIQKDCCNGMFLYEINRIYLIIMWIVSHPVFLQSAPDHPAHRPGSLISSKAGAAMPATVSVVLRDA